MEVPPNDDRIKNRRCMDFIRSSSICGTDTTSVFFDKLQPREQINQLTAFIDGSQVRSQIMFLIVVLSVNVFFNHMLQICLLDIRIYKRPFVYTARSSNWVWSDARWHIVQFRQRNVTNSRSRRSGLSEGSD